MGGPLFDCYVLAPRRTADAAMEFLDRFLPEREAQFDPSDPSDVLGVPEGASTRHIAEFLEVHPDVAYSMYWRHSEDGAPSTAILQYTADAHLILGLARCTEDDPACAKQVLAEMMATVAAQDGYAAVEEAPALSRKDFLRRVATRGGTV